MSFFLVVWGECDCSLEVSLLFALLAISLPLLTSWVSFVALITLSLVGSSNTRHIICPWDKQGARRLTTQHVLLGGSCHCMSSYLSIPFWSPE